MAETLFLSVSDIRSLIARVGFEPLTRLLAERLEHDFRRWPDFEKSKRVASYSHSGVIELMPISDGQRYSFKYVNGHPQNVHQSLPTVMAFGCLAEVTSGFPILLSEMTLLTAIRTAATSAVAAKAVANPGAKIMSIIGNGAQCEFQILAFAAILGVESFHLFDIDSGATDRLVRNLSSYPHLQLKRFSSAAEAIVDAEIITTATASKHLQRVLVPSMIQPGVHVNAIGGDCPGKTELDPLILENSKLFVEFEPQARVEGEIQLMTPDYEVTEIWKVLAGLSPGRTSSDDVTIFDSVGFSMEDFSILNLVFDLATQNGIGSKMDLIVRSEDPKDLFGCLVTK